MRSLRWDVSPTSDFSRLKSARFMDLGLPDLPQTDSLTAKLLPHSAPEVLSLNEKRLQESVFSRVRQSFSFPKEARVRKKWAEFAFLSIPTPETKEVGLRQRRITARGRGRRCCTEEAGVDLRERSVFFAR